MSSQICLVCRVLLSNTRTVKNGFHWRQVLKVSGPGDNGWRKQEWPTAKCSVAKKCQLLSMTACMQTASFITHTQVVYVWPAIHSQISHASSKQQLLREKQWETVQRIFFLVLFTWFPIHWGQIQLELDRAWSIMVNGQSWSYLPWIYLSFLQS